MQNIYSTIKHKAYLLATLLLLLCSVQQTAAQQVPGSPDLSFNPMDSINTDGANNYVYSMALQPDGKVLIGGYFTTYNSVGRII